MIVFQLKKKVISNNDHCVISILLWYTMPTIPAVMKSQAMTVTERGRLIIAQIFMVDDKGIQIFQK
jgi:hypothetical protein